MSSLYSILVFWTSCLKICPFEWNFFKIRVHEWIWSVTIFGAFILFMQFHDEWNDPYNLNPPFMRIAEQSQKSKVLRLENGGFVRWRFPREFIEVIHVFFVTYLLIWTPARPWTRAISRAYADLNFSHALFLHYYPTRPCRMLVLKNVWLDTIFHCILSLVTL